MFQTIGTYGQVGIADCFLTGILIIVRVVLWKFGLLSEGLSVADMPSVVCCCSLEQAFIRIVLPGAFGIAAGGSDKTRKCRAFGIAFQGR